MSRFDDLVDVAMGSTKVVIAVMLVSTIVVGAGAPKVQESQSLDQFQSDTTEAKKLDYIESNFTTGEENTTTVQIIVEGDDVLSKQSLLAMLRYERRLRANRTINGTLVDDRAVVSVATLVATTAIVREEGRKLRRLAAEFRRANRSFQANRTALQQRSDRLNATARQLREALTLLRRNPNASIRTQWERVRSNTSVELDEEDYATFETAAGDLRNATSESEAREAYRLGTQGVLREEYAAVQQRVSELEAEGRQLRQLGLELKQQREAFEAAKDPSLERQISTLREMDPEAVESTVRMVLNGSADSRALQLMPTDYEPGTAQADATVIIVTQNATANPQAGGSAPPAVIDSQVAMQELGDDDGLRYAVFGSGIIADEVDSSMEDSINLVAPLALLFVLLALVIAYRDPLDIVLGLLGIGAVLTWTFGLMGWAGIDFNQLFIAVPVLLIGLSIDYAIHIFMRHREERLAMSEADDVAADGSRPSMKVALGGVGIALVWVTATTAIGFLSNLTSPVPPIREFGIVSSAGIVAALLVFGLLIPALKIELDELLEGFGIDRRKRAFGTGGGRFSSLLAAGSTAARAAPFVVILVALLVSAGGAYGGSQVDTSFSQSDFLAEQPPEWMDRLPAQMQPGDYQAKANLERVNDNFVRQDSQAQVLVEGDVTDPAALRQMAAAQERANTRPVVQNLSTGEADLRSPLTVMRSVAAENASFNRTFHAADTDDDGVPDRNLTAVYDELFRVAPDEAAAVVHREDGEYRALRLVVSIQGGASGDEVTAQMRDVADEADDDAGLTATATGSAILNEIVQDQLLDTVIQSLLVTLVAVILFLMGAYRLTDGSATLGLVTMLPVGLTVAWILGTMFLLGIPFNVLTGMITSLTVGLGVAYCIHISERYTQELDRNGSVWDAMHTATTGTGGALLGSAATTVGGFGVLVFAILPPLQQFGLITGITIVYAFLASVLVLPSLLVVWTRFAGPADAREELTGSLSVLVGDDTEAASTSDEAGTEPAANGAGQAAVDGTAETVAGDDGTDGSAVAAGADEGANPVARRSVEFDHVHAGGTVEVRVELSDLTGRTLLSEAFDGTVEAVEEVHPEPVQTVVRDGRVYVAWDHDGDALVRYRATVPDWATDEDEPLFTGRVVTSDGAAPVSGVQRVTVVSDLFERVIARGTVTEADLAAAARQFDQGDLAPEQFERITQAWLDDDTALPSGRRTDPTED